MSICIGLDGSGGCPRHATQRGRCAHHARQSDRARGTRQQRGYGEDYDKARAEALASPPPTCPTCGDPFTTDNPATGGHRKARRHGGTTADGVHAECRRCNYGWRRTGS